MLSCLFTVATPYHVILCNFPVIILLHIYNSWYLNKPDEISQLNCISRCLISRCKSLLDCNVFSILSLISTLVRFGFERGFGVIFGLYFRVRSPGLMLHCHTDKMRTPGVEYFLERESLFFPRLVSFMSLSQLVTQISGLPWLVTCENYGTRDKWDVLLQLQ